MSRERTVCMMRIKNEERFIRRSLERTFQVCSQVVILDDGSDDHTEQECVHALGGNAIISGQPWGGWIGTGENAQGRCLLYFFRSPFVGMARPYCRVQEVRDKNFLWHVAQTHVDFDYCYCSDGDEVLTLAAIRRWPEAIRALETEEVDIIHLNYLYAWDGEQQIRTDAIYSGVVGGQRVLNFPRLFTIKRVDQKHLCDMQVAWFGAPRGGGMHCGSIPRHMFRVNGDQEPRSQHMPLDVLHLGYIDAALREQKVRWYRMIDPNNAAEGNYNHCVGEPDLHAPGPVTFQFYEDR